MRLQGTQGVMDYNIYQFATTGSGGNYSPGFVPSNDAVIGCDTWFYARKLLNY